MSSFFMTAEFDWTKIKTGRKSTIPTWTCREQWRKLAEQSVCEGESTRNPTEDDWEPSALSWKKNKKRTNPPATLASRRNCGTGACIPIANQLKFAQKSPKREPPTKAPGGCLDKRGWKQGFIHMTTVYIDILLAREWMIYFFCGCRRFPLSTLARDQRGVTLNRSLCAKCLLGCVRSQHFLSFILSFSWTCGSPELRGAVVHQF